MMATARVHFVLPRKAFFFKTSPHGYNISRTRKTCARTLAFYSVGPGSIGIDIPDGLLSRDLRTRSRGKPLTDKSARCLMLRQERWTVEDIAREVIPTQAGRILITPSVRSADSSDDLAVLPDSDLHELFAEMWSEVGDREDLEAMTEAVTKIRRHEADILSTTRCSVSECNACRFPTEYERRCGIAL